MGVFRTIIGITMALFFGFMGIVINSSDFGSEGPSFGSYLCIIGIYVSSSLIVGVFSKKYWPISILISWGIVLTGFPMFLVSIDKGHVKYAVFYFIGLFIIPLICLFSGFIGSKHKFKSGSYFRGRYFLRKCKKL